MRDAVKEIGSAVQWIDDPAETRVLALLLADFLHHIAPVGSRLHQDFANVLFGLVIGGRDSIGGTFARHLTRLDLVEVTAHPGRALSRPLFLVGISKTAPEDKRMLGRRCLRVP